MMAEKQIVLTIEQNLQTKFLKIKIQNKSVLYEAVRKKCDTRYQIYCPHSVGIAIQERIYL